MPAQTHTRAAPLALRRPTLDGAAVGVWLLAFLLPGYLAIEGGGYDGVLRGEVGIAVWWIVLLGALVGVLPAVRWRPAAWLAVAALSAFAAWSGLAATWSLSSEQTISELGRLAMYVGVLVLALSSITRETRRQALHGVAAGTALIALLALLSRLHPQWFGANITAAFLPGTRNRLNYPLNYWNALAAFVALGVPATLAATTSARRIATSALAAAALPVMGATLYATHSRGGVLALAVGLIVYIALAPDRLPKLLTLAAAGGGSAILISSIAQRHAVAAGLTETAARHQGNELIVVALVVCAGVALLQAGIATAVRHGTRPRWLVVSPARAGTLLGVATVAALVVFFAAHGPHALSRGWHDFKSPASVQTGAARFGSVAGNGRYQYWSAALHAFDAHPLKGIGPGTFQFYWTAHGSYYSPVINAHSLYLETLAEVGLVGIALLVLFLGTALVSGVAGAVREPQPQRLLLAGASAGIASFLVSAATDWVWQVPAIPVAFFVLVAICLAGARGPAVDRPALRLRMPVVVLAALGLAAIVIPLAGLVDVRESQAAAAKGRLQSALGHAGSAHDVQPYAASPLLQRALVLELQHRFGAAAVEARQATTDEPGNWRAWVVLSRIEAEAGNVPASVAAFTRARALDPHSPLFRAAR